MNMMDLLAHKLADEYQGPAMARMQQFAGIQMGQLPLPESPSTQEANLCLFPGLRQIPWYEAQEFDWCHGVESAAETIAGEFIEAERQQAGFELYRDLSDSNNVGWPGWEVLNLYSGEGYTPAAEHCPTTIDTLKLAQHGERQGFFSRLKPGAKIHPHTGGSNLVLTCHLGLDIPPDCFIKVGDEVRSWQAGKVLIFDDSFIHQVWNDSDQVRKVLIWDIWHPDLSVVEIAALTELKQLYQSS